MIYSAFEWSEEAGTTPRVLYGVKLNGRIYAYSWDKDEIESYRAGLARTTDPKYWTVVEFSTGELIENDRKELAV